MGTPKPRGYRKLATLIGSSRELATFRRFDDLNMLRIMRLQSELIDLEDQYNDACNEDDASDDPLRNNYTRSFRDLFDPQHATGNPQRQLFLEINDKLDEYNRALLQVASLERLPPPSDFSLEGLRKWLGDERLKNDFPQLRQMHTWDKQYDGDFILLANADKEVPFSFVFQKWVLGPLFRHLGPEKKRVFTIIDVEAGMGRFDDSTIVKTTKIIGTILAAILPVAVMVVLYVANSVAERFGFMALFTALFSSALIFFTSASLSEIFAATAAFAAVEVVFIGSTLKSA